MHKEHTAQEELFHGVLIALLVKQWDVVMVVHRVTVVGVSLFMKLTSYASHFEVCCFRI